MIESDRGFGASAAHRLGHARDERRATDEVWARPENSHQFVRPCRRLSARRKQPAEFGVQFGQPGGVTRRHFQQFVEERIFAAGDRTEDGGARPAIGRVAHGDLRQGPNHAGIVQAAEREARLEIEPADRNRQPAAIKLRPARATSPAAFRPIAPLVRESPEQGPGGPARSPPRRAAAARRAISAHGFS